MYQSVTTYVPMPLSFEYILEYFGIVKNVFSLLSHYKNPKKSLINKPNTLSFTYIEDLTDYYKSYMKQVKQKHVILLVDTLLIPLGYDPEKNKFEATYEGDITYLSTHIDKFVDEYFKISVKDPTKQETFIIRIGITLALNHPRNLK